MADGYLPDEEMLAGLFALPSDEWEEIFALAGRVTEAHKGNVVFVRGIVEFSSHCRRECAYCGLNRFNTKLERFRLTDDQIVETALSGFAAGYKTAVLQSGEDAVFTAERLAGIVSRIKHQAPMAITMSAGEMPREDYAILREAGCDRYLLKHETADETLYRTLHPESELSDRVACLRSLKELGFETGGGFMIGLPGQTARTIAKDLLLLRSIPCDMAGIGPFIAHPDTPLGGCENGSPYVARQAVALARLLLPDANLPATTSLGVLSKTELSKIFSGGANVIMKKLNPPALREQYNIYPAEFSKCGDTVAERKELEQMLTSLGKTFD
ncbi:MAG: [FeFe] hydrogenase H-cluster radical SAM maturase HydE [Ruminococcaceae bacterium]|nr:[FeFe] hydrogenase H-cluster radical SAM maturase HydE [Oscillospiraceae bacterium]